MTKRVFYIIATVFITLTINARDFVSPNGKVSILPKDKGYVIQYEKKNVLEIAAIGFEGSSNPSPLKFTKKVTEDYQMLAGKRLHCTNEANEYYAKIGKGKTLVMRLYNDGIAFRYEISGLKDTALPTEQTAYHIPEGTRRWMMQWADSYEGFYPLSTTAKTSPVRGADRKALSPDGYNRRWAFPALIEPVNGFFALMTEANIGRQQSASCLFNDGELFRVVPDENQTKVTGKWHSPWRVIIIGHLNNVIESTLVTDVCDPCQLEDTNWIQPGVVSWIYWAYNHGSNDYNIIKKYVDMAAILHLPYVLIDAEWDEMKDGKTIEDAINYAKSHDVKPMIWYNSSVGWINGAPGPKFRLNKPEDREREFAWCEQLGVAGVKIDFFSGDNQMNMDYCLDLLACAAKHHLLINFHGATIPRGWQRTWPNLLTTEAVYGAEWYNNVPTFTTLAAQHNATLPFTRNVIGPMDYTPCAFSDSQHPHITTNAHELALTVLYESGLQHLADKPDSYLAQPLEVQLFFSNLPSAWDETHFLGGYPGEYVVLARRRGNTWYVAGINGTDEAKAITLENDYVVPSKVTLFMDGESGQNPWTITQSKTIPTSVKLYPRGGFVFVIEQ